jgi:hypothetical protein
MFFSLLASLTFTGIYPNRGEFIPAHAFLMRCIGNVWGLNLSLKMAVIYGTTDGTPLGLQRSR